MRTVVIEGPPTYGPSLTDSRATAATNKFGIHDGYSRPGVCTPQGQNGASSTLLYGSSSGSPVGAQGSAGAESKRRA